MSLTFRMRRFGPRLLPWLAAVLFGVQLLGAHLHLHGEHHDHGGHVHTMHSACHSDLDHAGDGLEIGLGQALLGKLPDSHEPGIAVLAWLLAVTVATRQPTQHALQHSPPRLHKRAHYRPLLRAPPR